MSEFKRGGIANLEGGHWWLMLCENKDGQRYHSGFQTKTDTLEEILAAVTGSNPSDHQIERWWYEKAILTGDTKILDITETTEEAYWSIGSERIEIAGKTVLLKRGGEEAQAARDDPDGPWRSWIKDIPQEELDRAFGRR